MDSPSVQVVIEGVGHRAFAVLGGVAAGATEPEQFVGRRTRLRISPLAQRLLPAKFGANGEQALAAAGPPDQNGWVEVDLRVERQAVAVHDVLRLGADAEVPGPPELRTAVAETVTRLAARYAP